MSGRMIFCTGCNEDVGARLTNGAEIYPHRQDLAHLPFWKCDACGNFVGCHHKTKRPTEPLGCIPTPEIKAARKHIHRILDPIWKRKKMERRALYVEIANRMGIASYHTADIKSVEAARAAYKVVAEIAREQGVTP
ncbi:MAG: zinc-finger-containing protein [Sulfitobacter sp.]|uniref:zinc-finger-containing protein n=1 Tax=Sulfitobacter sp. TaxID=1903071 RepID=UPI003262DB40